MSATIATISTTIEPLIKRKVFADEEETIRVLMRNYLLAEITRLQRETERFEHKYGMHFQQFGAYLHERSVLIGEDILSLEQRQVLGQAIMQEEDDWLDWKMAEEMLESWLGLRREAVV